MMASNTENPEEIDNDQVEKREFTEVEQNLVTEFKKLCMSTIEISLEANRKIYDVEKSLETSHNAIYDKRKLILEEFKKKNLPGASLNYFWLNVLKASLPEFISETDEDILTYLTDIRSEIIIEPESLILIKFYFDANEYFSDSILTKTYYVSLVPDPENPLAYDCAEIIKCKGCEINWKNVSERYNSFEPTFFDFFSPPELPDEPDDNNYRSIYSLLKRDFDIGYYFKERIIPKAVIFFTREIKDCQGMEDEPESEDSNEYEPCEDGENNLAN